MSEQREKLAARRERERALRHRRQTREIRSRTRSLRRRLAELERRIERAQEHGEPWGKLAELDASRASMAAELAALEAGADSELGVADRQRRAA